MNAHLPSKRTWILVLTSIASLMVALDTLVVSTALTTIREDLGPSIEELEWTINAYNLSLAVLLLPAAARRSATASGAGACSRAAWRCSSRLRPPAPWLPTSVG